MCKIMGNFRALRFIFFLGHSFHSDIMHNELMNDPKWSNTAY